jgi:hypothetical protein
VAPTHARFQAEMKEGEREDTDPWNRRSRLLLLYPF